MQTVDRPRYPALESLGRRIGHGIAIVISLILLWVVQNLVAWDILPFLTGEFSSVVPWISFSLVLGVAAYAIYMVFDQSSVRSVGEIVTNIVTIVVSWQVLYVFPFDFSTYEFDWEIVAKGVLILAIVGAAIGVVAEVVKLARNQSG